MTTCSATWPGGSCTRADIVAHGLCAGHYMQQRRAESKGRPGTFRPLKLAHGADPRALERVQILLPGVDALAMADLAAERKQELAELYRDAVAEFLDKHRP